MTQIANLSIGHTTRSDVATGVTVFLFDQASPCSYFLPGSAPALRDVQLLAPEATVEGVDALVFTGGSAYGLGCTNGVMRWLQEQGRGYQVGALRVPIVPTAGLFDLHQKQFAFPSTADAYQACERAKSQLTEQGCIGAGAGATVGKGVPGARSMPGGFGYAEVHGDNEVKVLACAVVNSIGDVLNTQGTICAGAKWADGRFVGVHPQRFTQELTHTTLVAVFTNAILDKAQLCRLAKMATAGMARAIQPVFTPHDGDVVFAVSVGELVAKEMIVGHLAAQAVQQAIINAIKG